MPRTPQDLTKSQENLQNQKQINQPEQPVEAPVVIKVEKEIQPEKVEPDKQSEIVEDKKEQVVTAQPTATVTTVPTTDKSLTLGKIEDILEEDLGDAYFQMTPEKQQQFQKAGEDTANSIEKLLTDAKLKIRKILDLIRKWLKIIPGINKFFLEQEAKIKADKILEIKEKQQKQKEAQPQVESQQQEDQNKI